MVIVVGSQRKGSLTPPLGAVVVRIDRTSVLGNPFDMQGDEAMRQFVVKAHQAWLDVVLERSNSVDAVKLAIEMAAQLGLTIASTWKHSTSRDLIEELYRVEQLAQTQEVWIMCWCAPETCHSNAYQAALESRRITAAYEQMQKGINSTATNSIPSRLTQCNYGQ